MYAPYDAEIDFLQDQISVLSDEIAERDKHIESLKSERVSVGYEAGGFAGRASRASSTTAPSDDGDRDVELQASTLAHNIINTVNNNDNNNSNNNSNNDNNKSTNAVLAKRHQMHAT